MRKKGQSDKKRPEGNGNTKTLSGHSPRYRNWFFTLNNPEKDDKEILIDILGQKGQYLFQLEKGKEGTIHYQGVFFSKSNIAFTTLQKINGKIHWEKARNKKACLEYCSKEDTHIQGERYTNIKLPRKLKDPLKDLELYKFQKDILDMIKTEPDDRKIYWFWDEEGNIGKTTLAKHICMNYNAIYLGGKGADIKYGVSQYISKHPEGLDICIFGFPRSLEDYVSYQSLEEIKDGFFFSGKYEGGMCMYNTPHVIVMANFQPNTSKLSSDRWVIREVSAQPRCP